MYVSIIYNIMQDVTRYTIYSNTIVATTVLLSYNTIIEYIL